jgi:hypothetical protein
MSGPDVRWEGVSHEQIVAWTSKGRGAKVTELLEARLTSAAEALNQTADLINTTLQRVNGGEWTGNAATVAAAAMQVMRDFDDTMGHHGTTSTLAAFGQSDNADWAKASVPPVVDMRPPQSPTGNPADLLALTEDFHDQVHAAKDAETRARQVMSDYTAMTTDRIAAMPRLAPPPQVVLADPGDTITSAPRPGDSPDGSSHDYVPPRGGKPDGGDTSGNAAAPRPGGTVPAGPQGGPPIPLPPAGTDRFGTAPSGTAPSGTAPPGTGGIRPPLTLSPGGGPVGEPPRTFSPVGGFTRTVGGPGVEGGRGPLRGGGQTGGIGGPRPGEPGARGAHPGVGARGGAAEILGRSGTARGGAPGMAPLGAAGRSESDEDKDHQVKYGVPGSEIFEPDHDDGLLHDPFHPGSYVAPASIGEEDE